MLTNLMVSVAVSIATNWTPVEAKWDPDCRDRACLRHLQDVFAQKEIGTLVTNTEATLVWNGATNRVRLESKEAACRGDLVREVPDAAWRTMMTNSYITNLVIFTNDVRGRWRTWR
jgi:hypothetical protein